MLDQFSGANNLVTVPTTRIKISPKKRIDEQRVLVTVTVTVTVAVTANATVIVSCVL